MIININGWISKIPFIKKIYSRILNIILNSREEFIVNFKNIRLFINIKDPIDKIIFYRNEYEEKQIKFLYGWIKKNKPNIFIDIGANCGVYSLRISRLFQILKVIAFEPVLTTFNKLKMNIKINNLGKRIKTYNVGLSNANGLKKMVALKRRNYIQSGGFSFNTPKRKLTDEEITQYNKTIKGDEVLKFKKKKIVVKIDVEGYENKVLLGIKNLLKNNKILLQIEIFDYNFKKINKFLLEKRFKLINKFNKTSDYFYINY
jgi:FkbM family methyltransferase